MGRRGLQRGCRRVVVPSAGGCRRAAELVLPGGSGGWWCGLLALAGRCLAGVCCSTGSLAFRCACTCVRALPATRVRRGTAAPSPLQAGPCGSRDLMRVAAKYYVMLYRVDFSLLSLLTCAGLTITSQPSAGPLLHGHQPPTRMTRTTTKTQPSGCLLGSGLRRTGYVRASPSLFVYVSLHCARKQHVRF
jgi:hypothetical protein